MMKLENSKVLASLEGVLILRYFLACLSDLNFCVNIYSRKLFNENERDLKPISEQIRTNTKIEFDLLKFLTFNQLQKQHINHLVSLYYLTLTTLMSMIKGNRTIENLLNSLSLDISTRNYALKSEFPMNTACMCNNQMLCATRCGDTEGVPYKWRIVRKLQTYLTKINAHVYDIVMSCFQSLGLLTYFRWAYMTKEAYAYFLSPVIIDNQYSDEFPLCPSQRQQQRRQLNVKPNQYDYFFFYEFYRIHSYWLYITDGYNEVL